MIAIRFTNFYAKAINSNSQDIFSQILNVSFNAEPRFNTVRDYRYDYHSDEPFSTMVYDRNTYKTQFENVLPYDEAVKQCISKFITSLYDQCKYWFEDNNYPIVVVYGDDVHESFGKELFENAVMNTFNQIFEQHKFKQEIQFKHIVNVIPGQVISMETDFLKSIFSLYSGTYLPSNVKESQIVRSLEGNEENKNVIAYIQDRDIYDYRRKHDKYFISVDFAAKHTVINTYLLHNRVVTLFDKKVLNIGFMDIVEWIYAKCRENSTRTKPLFEKFNEFISNISYLGGQSSSVYFKYYTCIEEQDYYLNSPMSEVINACIEVTNKIYTKHQFDRRVEIKYCVENIVEMHLKHIQLEDINFNGNSHAMIQRYITLDQARKGELMFGGLYTSEVLVDKVTKRNHFNLRLNLKDLGFEYSFEDLDA